MVESESRQGTSATSDREPLLWQGSFIDLPPDELAAWMTDAQRTVEDLSEVGSGFHDAMEHPESYTMERADELVRVAAERRALILDEIAKRLEQTKSTLAERIVAAKDEARSLRDRHGIDPSD